MGIFLNVYTFLLSIIYTLVFIFPLCKIIPHFFLFNFISFANVQSSMIYNAFYNFLYPKPWIAMLSTKIIKFKKIIIKLFKPKS